MEMVLFLIIGLGAFMLFYGLVRVPGESLSKKFVSLGTLKGRSYDDICMHVGEPNAVSAKTDGKICQWIKSGYHIALIFDNNNICQGVTHEAKV